MRTDVPRFLLILAAMIAPLVGLAAPAGPYSPEALDLELGRYEKLGLEEALAREQAVIDPLPEGKILDRIRVVNLDVFSSRDGFISKLNFFHVTSKSYIVEREVLLRPGQMWKQALVDETARNLEIPEYSSLVVLVPVRSAKAGHVDLLVVTRDVWSLRTNTKFEIQNSTIVRLLMFPAENNFLGRRKQVAAKFDLDLGALAIGPRYVDPNIYGTRMTFEGFAQVIFNRDTKNREGERIDVTLAMPLWALARRWGGSLRVNAENYIDRTFRDTEVLLYPDPEREDAVPGEERAPRSFRLKTIDVRAEGVISRGEWFKNRFFFGGFVSSRRPHLIDSFTGSAELEELFRVEVLGRSERLVGPLIRYEGLMPTFAKYKNVDTLDLVEDVNLGPTMLLEVAPALSALGSDVDAFRFTSSLGVTLDLAGTGYFRASLGGNARIDDIGVTDADVEGQALIVLPPLGHAGRLVVFARLRDLLRNGKNEILLAGAQNGLRGYRIGEFSGETQLTINAEWRTPPIALKALRVGGVAFWDAGHAAAQASDLDLHHNVGIGFRTVLPQDTKFVNRFDWAIPLSGPRRGFPGRFSIAFAQFF